MKLFYFVLVGLLVFLLFPFLYLNKESCLMIHDNLDGEFVYNHLLKVAGLLFSFKTATIVPYIMNGIPRVLFHSEFSFIRLLYYIFPAFWAYIANYVIVRLIGFIGMYLFARDYLLKDIDNKIVVFFAVIFSVIPVYTLYGLPVLGQPVLIWAFLNLSYNHKSYTNWLIILLYPAYAHFAFIAPFIITALGMYGIYRLFQKDQTIGKSYFIALVLLLGSFLAFNCLTISSFISHTDYVSHRIEWTWIPVTLRGAMDESIDLFINGHPHSAEFNALPIYLLTLIALFYVRKDKKKVGLILGCVILIGVLSIFYAIYPSVCYYSQGFAHILSVFQFRRFILLVPTLWFFIFGLSIRYISSKNHLAIIYAVFVLQTVVILRLTPEIRFNYERMITHKEYYPSFQSFFSEDLFADISKFIGKPKSEYRVVSIGIHPSIAQYNGFYTLDSYQNNYPLEYKHEFRKIIAGELDKDEKLKQYFDGWGNRCYVFSDELYKQDYMYVGPSTTFKGNNKEIKNLNIDAAQLKKMGAQYIFSAVPIDNAQTLHLEYQKTFTDKKALWDIYLYKI